MPRSFAELIEGCTYLLDWRIGGVQKEYRAMIEKKNEEAGTVYLRLFVEPHRLVRMVCYRALIDAPASAADRTWFGGFTLKVDRGPVDSDR